MNRTLSSEGKGIVFYGLMVEEMMFYTHTIADGIARLAHPHAYGIMLILKFFVLTPLELLKDLQTIDLYTAFTVRNNVNYCH